MASTTPTPEKRTPTGQEIQRSPWRPPQKNQIAPYQSSQPTNDPCDQKYPPDKNRIEVDSRRKKQWCPQKTCGTQREYQRLQRPESKPADLQICVRPRKHRWGRRHRPYGKTAHYPRHKRRISQSGWTNGPTNRGLMKSRTSLLCCTIQRPMPSLSGNTYSTSPPAWPWQVYGLI